MANERIGVVSDTHGKLPQKVFDLFHGDWSTEELRERISQCTQVRYDEAGHPHLEEGDAAAVDARACDLILHIGDIGVQSVLDELGAITRTIAVLGNNDLTPYWCSDGDVRPFRSLTFEGVGVAMQHRPNGLERSLHGAPPHTEPRVTVPPHLAVHGHTHVPRLELDGDTVILCPGSPTQARRGSGHHVALVDLHDGKLNVITFVNLD